LRTTAKAAVAVAAAAGFALLPFSRLLAVIGGGTLYLVVLVVLRAIPRDVWSAIAAIRPSDS